jgi:hypothetical protein
LTTYELSHFELFSDFDFLISDFRLQPLFTKGPPMNNPITGLPGVGAARVSTPREITAGNAQFAQFVPGLRTIDGSRSRDPLNAPDVDVLRAGLLLGKTSGGKYAPSILGILTSAAMAGATTLNVSLAAAVELVRRIGTTGNLKLTGPPTAGGTVATTTLAYSAVNTSTGVITCAATPATVVGSFIQPTDGSETIVTILGNKWGVKVTDLSGASTDVLEDQLLLAGHVKTANVINYPSDTSLVAYVKAALRVGGVMTFDDAF